MTQIRYLEPIRWKEKTEFHKFYSDLHTWTVALADPTHAKHTYAHP